MTRTDVYNRRQFLYMGAGSVISGYRGIEMPIISSHRGSIAASARSGYAATVDGLPGGGPLAHWRLGEAEGEEMFDRKGARHGAYSGTVGFGATGLPQGSDAAVNFNGTGSAAVPHDPGLALPAFSLSLWFKYNTLPPELASVLISKDQSGLFVGDFSIWTDDLGELSVVFQDATTAHTLFAAQPIVLSSVHHLCVRADNTGFDAYLDGSYLGKITTFTDAWASNSQAIQIGTAPWTSALVDAVIDEIALYDRLLTEAEVVTLSQRTSAPIAVDDSFVAPESATTVLDVVANDTFIGQKANLTVEVISQPTHGSATVRSDNDIDFAADAVTQDEADSFTYRITDADGISNTATANVTVQNSASQGGGTLVYDFQPQASWIDDVALADRDGDDISVTQPWIDGASVGGSLVKGIVIGGPVNNGCWNRAPTDHPSLEVRTAPNSNGSSMVNFAIQLYDHLGTGAGPHPRHLRIVAEIKTCKSSDPTTYKADGLGTTSGSYPNWSTINATGKYYTGLYMGESLGGGCQANWWGNSDHQITGFGVRPTFGSSSLNTYTYAFDRPGTCGLVTRASVGRNESGIHGVWHKLEIEVFLTDPATVPDNARRSEPEIEPDHVGDGFVKMYMTKDIDGELGTPGTRQQVVQVSGLIFSPKFDDVRTDDNMHLLANIGGFWLHHTAQAADNNEVWAWIRRIQVFRHD